jgi:hypothetical protein
VCKCLERAQPEDCVRASLPADVRRGEVRPDVLAVFETNTNLGQPHAFELQIQVPVACTELVRRHDDPFLFIELAQLQKRISRGLDSLSMSAFAFPAISDCLS